MDMGDAGLGQALKMVEERFGPKVTTCFVVVVVLAITSFCLGVILSGINDVFSFMKDKKLIPENMVIPTDGAPYIVAAAFIVILLVVLWIFFRQLYGIRRAPQRVVDALAEERSWAITNILNKPPHSDEELEGWLKSLKDWRERCITTMKPHVTKAERMKFEHLGILLGMHFPGIYNDKHHHSLMKFAKRLSVLEGIIERHMR